MKNEKNSRQYGTHSEDMTGNIRGVPSLSNCDSYGIAEMFWFGGNIISHKLTGSIPELYVPRCVIARREFHFRIVVRFL